MISSLRSKPKPYILVVGDLMIDHYLWGRSERISPEAPVQVVDVERESRTLGGAGNVVNNLVALGARVGVASAIGDDDNGKELKQMLDSIGIDTDMIVVEQGRKSSKKSRIIASNQQILRYDKESKESIAQQTSTNIYSAIKNSIDQYDIIVLSDYGKGVLSEELSQSIIRAASQQGVKVLVDPKGVNYKKYRGAYLLTPNRKEAIEATGIDIIDDATLTRALQWLQNECDLECSMITLSEDGIGIYDDGLKIFATAAQEVYDVTGAGDTVIASMAYALGVKRGIDEAAKFANLAAGVVVAKIGSAIATFDEIEEYEASLHQSDSTSHIKTADQIRQIVNRAKERGKQIVFTNGCFDIIHVGHVKYLQEAKSFGDILIVGLNSDASVKALKGDSRPINPEADRAYILAALESVDYVVGFSQSTPIELIDMIRPDTLVKGGDYLGKEVVGSELSGETRLVEFVDGKSTTTLIQKIQKGSKC